MCGPFPAVRSMAFIGRETLENSALQLYQLIVTQFTNQASQCRKREEGRRAAVAMGSPYVVGVEMLSLFLF